MSVNAASEPACPALALWYSVTCLANEYPESWESSVLKRVSLILALLTASAAADDYRSYREAYAGIDWPNTITSTEQCQRRVVDIVARFGFADPEVNTSKWTGNPDFRVKDQTRHFRITFDCDPKKRIVTINIVGGANQVGSAANLLDRLINSFTGL
jgi:hypothetical protein